MEIETGFHGYKKTDDDNSLDATARQSALKLKPPCRKGGVCLKLM